MTYLSFLVNAVACILDKFQLLDFLVVASMQILRSESSCSCPLPAAQVAQECVLWLSLKVVVFTLDINDSHNIIILITRLIGTDPANIAIVCWCNRINPPVNLSSIGTYVLFLPRVVYRPIPSFSMLHAANGNGPGGEAISCRWNSRNLYIAVACSYYFPFIHETCALLCW